MSVVHFGPFGDPLRQIDRLTSQLLFGTPTPMGMPMDVWQEDDGYHVALDLPGVEPSTVEITSERNVVILRAQRAPLFEQANAGTPSTGPKRRRGWWVCHRPRLGRLSTHPGTTPAARATTTPARPRTRMLLRWTDAADG